MFMLTKSTDPTELCRLVILFGNAVFFQRASPSLSIASLTDRLTRRKAASEGDPQALTILRQIPSIPLPLYDIPSRIALQNPRVR